MIQQHHEILIIHKILNNRHFKTMNIVQHQVNNSLDNFFPVSCIFHTSAGGEEHQSQTDHQKNRTHHLIVFSMVATK